ncbi:MAG: bacteriohemerythrin [Gammaproteobacteria bacterium]
MADEDIEYFEIFPWDNNFETGIALIDEQHKQLVNILNQLAAHLANRSNPITLNKIFDELAEYADYHFKTEEEIWSAHFVNDDWFTSHVRTHESFIAKVIEMRQGENVKPLDDVIQDIVAFLSHWLASHILDTDKRMSKAVLAIESGLPLEQAKIQANYEMSGSMRVLIDTVLTMYDSLSGRTMDLMREKSLRKQAEAALLASEQRWQFILEDTGENVWDWDIEHGDITFSDNKSSLFDAICVQPDETGKAPTIHPSDIRMVRNALQDHLDGNTEFFTSKHRVLHKSGSWSWVLTRGKIVSRNENGEALRMVGTHSDVTERELAGLLFQHSSQSMLVTDKDNAIICCNPAFTKMSGYLLEDIVGKNPGFFASGKHDKAFYQDMWDSITTKGEWSGEIWDKRKNGEIYPQYLNINTVSSSDGTVDHYIALSSDITEQKLAEEKLVEAKEYAEQANLAKSQFLSQMSHELRTPLHAILGFAQLLDMDKNKNLSKEQKKGISQILSGGWHLLDLVQDLLDLSSVESHRMELHTESIDVIECINNCLDSIEPLAQKRDIDVCNTLSPCGKIYVRGDPVRLKQVLINLLSNAVKYNKEGGTITVSCEQVQTDSVRISITDTGSGIPEADQAIVFDPFNRRYMHRHAMNGTGLGLSITKQLVELMQGRMGLTSKLGYGSTFWIELDSSQPPVKDIPGTVTPGVEMPELAGTTLLYIEDSPSHVQLLETIIDDMPGLRLLSAHTPSLGLEMALAHQPDLIILDICLPEMDGFEVLKRLQSSEITNKIPVIAVSANALRNDIEKGLRAGFRRYLSKPINVIEFRRVVEELLSNNASY